MFFSQRVDKCGQYRACNCGRGFGQCNYIQNLIQIDNWFLWISLNRQFPSHIIKFSSSTNFLGYINTKISDFTLEVVLEQFMFGFNPPTRRHIWFQPPCQTSRSSLSFILSYSKSEVRELQTLISGKRPWRCLFPLVGKLLAILYEMHVSGKKTLAAPNPAQNPLTIH